MYEIPRDLWNQCEICKMSLKDIKIEFGGGNKYFSYSFKDHLKKHDITIEDYFIRYKGLSRPICICGVCNKLTDIKIHGANILWKKYKCGLYEGTKKWSETAKETRKGAGNPMYGQEAWNKGLDVSDPRIKRIADARTGTVNSPETRKKLSIARQLSPLKARHTTPHSEKTKAFIRENTISMIKKGFFRQTKSKCHIALGVILDELNIKYEEEKQLGHFCVDYYLPLYNTYIEVDGDYWHSNPLFYPDGPKSKTQKINYSRDCSKNKYCERNNIKLHRFWENDILKNREMIKDKIKCILNQLNQLNILAN